MFLSKYFTQDSSPATPQANEWSQWLGSLETQSTYKKIVIAGNSYNYLSLEEIKSKNNENISTKQVNLAKIIQVTQDIFQDPLISHSSEEKLKMLEGIEYIHRRHQEKYKNLPFLIRCCINIIGKRKQHLNQEKAIENLRQAAQLTPEDLQAMDKRISFRLSLGYESIEMVPVKIDHSEVIPFSTLLKQEEQKLNVAEPQVSNKDEWYEQVFKFEKELQLAKKLPNLTDAEKGELVEIEKRLKKKAPEIVHVSQIVKYFPKVSLEKANLQEILSSVCRKQHISHAPEAANYFDTKLKEDSFNVKYWIKSKKLDLPFTMLRSADLVWRKFKQDNVQQAQTYVIKDHLFVMAPDDAYLMEQKIGQGGFKVVSLMTPIIGTKKEDERGQYVLQQSWEHYTGDQQLLEESAEKGKTTPLSSFSSSSISSFSSNEHSYKTAQEEFSEEQIDQNQPKALSSFTPASSEQTFFAETTFVEHSAKSSLASSTGTSPTFVEKEVTVYYSCKSESGEMTVVEKETIEKKSLEQNTDHSQGKINELDQIGQKMKADRLKEKLNKVQQAVIQPLANTSALEPSTGFQATHKKMGQKVASEELAFQKEAAYCEAYRDTPGIWPTREVLAIDGRTVIIAKAAFYVTEKKKEVIHDLSGLTDQLKINGLSQKEQLDLMDMVDQFLLGLSTIHKDGLIHRDIKPDNILVSSDSKIKAGLADFGVTCAVKNDPDKNTPAGSRYYMAPEGAIPRNKQMDVSSDIWSVGMVLWQVFSKYQVIDHYAQNYIPRYAQEDEYLHKLRELALPESMANKDYSKKSLKIGAELDKKSLAHLVWRCTQLDPTQRPTVEEVRTIYKEWTQETKEKLQADPSKSLLDCFGNVKSMAGVVLGVKRG